jgi:hypothetical protein
VVELAHDNPGWGYTRLRKAHWEGLAAMDFFTVEVATLGGLVRYSVLFAIELSTRKVHIAGMTSQPKDAWMQNTAIRCSRETSGGSCGAAA